MLKKTRSSSCRTCAALLVVVALLTIVPGGLTRHSRGQPIQKTTKPEKKSITEHGDLGPWSLQSIGQPNEGRARRRPPEVQLQGASEGYSPTRDSLHFLSRASEGNFEFTARIDAIENIGLGRKKDSSSSPSLATQVIDFESLSSSGEIVRNQFASRGVIFQPVLGIDYSQDSPIPAFAHSGTKALELCRGVEFCRAKLDISFTTPQRRVKIWTGFTGPLDNNPLVLLRAYDANGNEVNIAANTLGPSNQAIPISKPLEVTVPSAIIVRVTVGFIAAEPSIGTMFNNGLAFDDLEFDDLGTAPQCQATQPPAIIINDPTDGRIVAQNAFTLDANLTTPDPFATLEINATGPGGLRVFGPIFAASGHIQIFNISGLLSLGQNTLVFTVKDCTGLSRVTRTVFFRQITRTNIHVIDENGSNVQTARVYADGTFIGLTDPVGLLSVTPPLATGTRLVARKIIHESSTGRGNHSQGSSKNWNFRVYTYSMAVNNNGSLTSQAVSYQLDANAPQVLRINRRNTLIGLHWVTSIQWDASAAEMETIKQNLIEASKVLYNATDGQIFIEQAELVDDKKFWLDADMRVEANQQLGAYVNRPIGAFLFKSPLLTFLSRMHVRFSNPPGVYVHEFGHYGFGLDDEYKGDSPHCTALSLDTAPANIFAHGRDKASCMMGAHSDAKFCSHRSENPHKKGTNQGDSSCWSTLSGLYRDSDSTQRWILRTPDTRGAIPGAINGKNLPLSDMALKVTLQNGNRPNLCEPIMVLAKHSDGTPHQGREIWLSTTYGQNIFQGKTNPAGNLTVTGVHVGDSIEGTKIEFANCAITAGVAPRDTRPHPFINATIPVKFSQNVQQESQRLQIGATPFSISTTLKPTKAGAQITVAVEDTARQTVALAKPPVVKFQTESKDGGQIRLRYDANIRSYSGTIRTLPDGSEVEIAVEATDRGKQVLRSFHSFRIMHLDPKSETDVISPDGQLTLTVPTKALPAGARIAIGSHSSSLPTVPDGNTFVSGPQAVWSYPASKLATPATITFELPRQGRIPAFANYSKESLRVLRFDGGKWVDIGGVVQTDSVSIVTVRTTQLGVFALVGKKVSKEYQDPTSPRMSDQWRNLRLEEILTDRFLEERSSEETCDDSVILHQSNRGQTCSFAILKRWLEIVRQSKGRNRGQAFDLTFSILTAELTEHEYRLA